MIKVKRVMDLTEVTNIGVPKVSLETPFDTIWFFGNHKYWDSDKYFEIWMQSRSTISLVFARWHNLEVNVIKATPSE